MFEKLDTVKAVKFTDSLASSFVVFVIKNINKDIIIVTYPLD